MIIPVKRVVWLKKTQYCNKMLFYKTETTLSLNFEQAKGKRIINEIPSQCVFYWCIDILRQLSEFLRTDIKFLFISS